MLPGAAYLWCQSQVVLRCRNIFRLVARPSRTLTVVQAFACWHSAVDEIHTGMTTASRIASPWWGEVGRRSCGNNRGCHCPLNNHRKERLLNHLLPINALLLAKTQRMALPVTIPLRLERFSEVPAVCGLRYWKRAARQLVALKKNETLWPAPLAILARPVLLCLMHDVPSG